MTGSSRNVQTVRRSDNVVSPTKHTKTKTTLFLTTHSHLNTPHMFLNRQLSMFRGPHARFHSTINTTASSNYYHKIKPKPLNTFKFSFSFSLHSSSHGISNILLQLLRRPPPRGAFLRRRLRSRSVAGARAGTRCRSCRIRFELGGRDWSVGCSFNACHLQTLMILDFHWFRVEIIGLLIYTCIRYGVRVDLCTIERKRFYRIYILNHLF